MQPIVNLLFGNKFFISHKVTSVLLATVLHIAVATGIVISNSNSSFTAQSIRVSFVAPQMTASQSGLTQNNNSITAQGGKSALSKESGKHNITKETSGKEDVNAKNLSSAVTEPIFDAAYLNNPAPVYPQSAKKDGIEGKVMLLVEVSEHGVAKSVKVSQSSGYTLLDGSAISAVQNWKFVPAKNFGHHVSSSVIVPVEFKLS